MNEFDVLKSISENLSERKSSAALNNYEVLCNNVNYVNNLFRRAVASFAEIQSLATETLKDGTSLRDHFKDTTKPLFYFRKIIPRVLSNGISICEKFIINTMPDNRMGITIETVGKLHKGFVDYNNLVTTSRQYIDSLVSDAYQLILLDPKSLNYHVLVSLNSFNKYVTKSIRQGLFNEDVESALAEFEKLPFNQWFNSSITRCSRGTFAQKVDYLFDELNIVGKDEFKDDVKNLFKFSSEFTHIGYVSTLFTSSIDSEVVFGDDIGPYLLSTENFNELKYQILETAVQFYYMVYLPSVIYCFNKAFDTPVFVKFQSRINSIICEMNSKFKTRNNQYSFFIREGLIGSKKVIDLTCICGATQHWEPPHEKSKLYCNNCGSSFTLIEIEGDPGYVITSDGPIKVIGSSVPDFHDLPIEKRHELLRQCQNLIKAKKHR
jgi:hypothetical protein